MGWGVGSAEVGEVERGLALVMIAHRYVHTMMAKDEAHVSNG